MSAFSFSPNFSMVHEPSVAEKIATAVSGRLRSVPRKRFRLKVSAAFQPIVNVRSGRVFGYESLVRTLFGEGARLVLEHVTSANRISFDLTCRAVALKKAAELGLRESDAALCLNINPNNACEPEAAIERMLEQAHELNFPLQNIVLEITEEERLRDAAHLNRVMNGYRRAGIRVAIDDFGAGFAGLSLLASLEADMVKVDMGLVRDIDQRKVNRSIVEGLVEIARQNGIAVIGEGVETEGEAQTLLDLGVELMQGYYFAQPGFEYLPLVRRVPMKGRVHSAA